MIDPRTDLPQYIRDIIPQPRQNIVGITLRNANTRTLPNTRTTLFQQSFIPRTTKQWNNLPNSTRTDPDPKSFKRAIDDRFGTEETPKFNNVGSKMGNILHTRLRLNASVLNAHLFKIQKTVSPCCECGDPKETVAHFVLNCPRFNMLRSALFDQVSRVIPSFSHISGLNKLNLLLYGIGLSENQGLEVAGLFQNFIIKTKRFL